MSDPSNAVGLMRAASAIAGWLALTTCVLHISYPRPGRHQTLSWVFLSIASAAAAIATSNSPMRAVDWVALVAPLVLFSSLLAIEFRRRHGRPDPTVWNATFAYFAAGVMIAAHLWRTAAPMPGPAKWGVAAYNISVTILAAVSLASAAALARVVRSDLPDTPAQSSVPPRLALIGCLVAWIYSGWLLLGGPLPPRVRLPLNEPGIVPPLLAMAIVLGSLVAWMVPHQLQQLARNESTPRRSLISLLVASILATIVFGVLVCWT